jgi:hypothetical protein
MIWSPLRSIGSENATSCVRCRDFPIAETGGVRPCHVVRNSDSRNGKEANVGDPSTTRSSVLADGAKRCTRSLSPMRDQLIVIRELRQRARRKLLVGKGRWESLGHGQPRDSLELDIRWTGRQIWPCLPHVCHTLMWRTLQGQWREVADPRQNSNILAEFET